MNIVLEQLLENEGCGYINHWAKANRRFSEFLYREDVKSKVASIIQREKGNRDKLLDRLSELKFAHNVLKLPCYSIIKYEYVPDTESHKSIDFRCDSPYGIFNVEVARINPNPIDKLRETILKRLSNSLIHLISSYSVHVSMFNFNWPINMANSRMSKSLIREYQRALNNQGVTARASDWISSVIAGSIKRLTNEKSKEDACTFPLFEWTDDDNVIHDIRLSLSLTYILNSDGLESPTKIDFMSYSINYTGFEFEKYGNRVEDKIGQLATDSPNLFIMHSDSDTHDPGHGSVGEFISAVNSCMNRMELIHTDQESVNNSKRLSAAMLITDWSGYDYSQCVWRNKKAIYGLNERILFDLYCVYSGN